MHIYNPIRSSGPLCAEYVTRAGFESTRAGLGMKPARVEFYPGRFHTKTGPGRFKTGPGSFARLIVRFDQICQHTIK